MAGTREKRAPKVLADRSAGRARIERDAAALLAALDDLARANPEGVRSLEVMAALEISATRARAAMFELAVSGRCNYAAPDGYLSAIWPRGALPPMGLHERVFLEVLREELARGNCGILLREAVCARLNIYLETCEARLNRLALRGAISRVDERAETPNCETWRICDEERA